MGNETAWIGYVVLGVIYLAIVYGMVRPGSPVSNIVNEVGNSLKSLVSTATGYSGSSAPSAGTQIV